MLDAMWLSLGAGFTITIGALLASVERIRPRWLEQEFRHFVIAFGGGALLSAIALVLVPDGIEHQSAASAIISFLAGGVAFMAVDIALSRRKSQVSQMLAMMLDFVPEAIVLGAVIATEKSKAVLIAIIIAAQNLPEGFNAYREMAASHAKDARKRLWWFVLLGVSGPIYALIGAVALADAKAVLGALMTFCAGGILYLTFQDIAPQARLKQHWLPTLGAVLGFLVGMAGHILTSGA